MRKRLILRTRGAACRRPLLWEVGKRCKVVWNVRRVSMEGDEAEAAVELTGRPRQVAKAMALLRKRGASLFPVERAIFE